MSPRATAVITHFIYGFLSDACVKRARGLSTASEMGRSIFCTFKNENLRNEEDAVMIRA